MWHEGDVRKRGPSVLAVFNLLRRSVVLGSLTKWSRLCYSGHLDEPRNGPQKDSLYVQRLLCFLNAWFGCVL
jgi:hypothetical protein